MGVESAVPYIEPKTAEHFSVGCSWLRKSESLRLDASFYNPRVAHAIETLRRSGVPLKTLGEVTKAISIPPRFGRVYVQKEHGIPFLQGSHIVQFQSADLKYISRSVHKDMEKWLIREGWILVTRSGTVGRVTITPKEWDGWAASEHILRIVPDDAGSCPGGYVYAFLSSPIGQAQLTAQIYGAVVDELTEEQAKSILIPVAETLEQTAIVTEINRLAIQSVGKKMEAVALADASIAEIDSLIPTSEAEEERIDTEIARQRLAEIRNDPTRLVTGKALEERFERWQS